MSLDDIIYDIKIQMEFCEVSKCGLAYFNLGREIVTINCKN